MRPSLAVEGCTNISLPIHDHTGTVIAALTVPFLPQKTARLDTDAVFDRAAMAAEQISVALGAGEGST
jgi:DNA-binding IclR family transcriptional regulator